MAGAKKSPTGTPKSPMSGNSGTYSAPRSPGTPNRRNSTGNITKIERKKPSNLAPPPKTGRGKSPMKSPKLVKKTKALETVAACEEGTFSGIKLLLQVVKPPPLMPVSVKPPSKKSAAASPKMSPQKKKVSPRKRKVAKKEVHAKLLPPVDDEEDAESPQSPIPEGSPLNKKITSAAPSRPPPPAPLDPIALKEEGDDSPSGRRSSLQVYSLVPDSCPMEALPTQHHHLARILEACNQSPHALARYVL